MLSDYPSLHFRLLLQLSVGSEACDLCPSPPICVTWCVWWDPFINNIKKIDNKKMRNFQTNWVFYIYLCIFLDYSPSLAEPDV